MLEAHNVDRRRHQGQFQAIALHGHGQLGNAVRMGLVFPVMTRVCIAPGGFCAGAKR